MAFPCNQFGGQEPGTNEEIKQFAAERNFVGMLMDKIDVNGNATSPVYSYLKEAAGLQFPILWNFEKFLVGKDGKVAGHWRTTTDPSSLIPDIDKLLDL